MKGFVSTVSQFKHATSFYEFASYEPRHNPEKRQHFALEFGSGFVSAIRSIRLNRRQRTASFGCQWFATEKMTHNNYNFRREGFYLEQISYSSKIRQNKINSSSTIF